VHSISYLHCRHYRSYECKVLQVSYQASVSQTNGSCARLSLLASSSARMRDLRCQYVEYCTDRLMMSCAFIRYVLEPFLWMASISLQGNKVTSSMNASVNIPKLVLASTRPTRTTNTALGLSSTSGVAPPQKISRPNFVDWSQSLFVFSALSCTYWTHLTEV
jgi:hypothetical protein